MMRKRCELCESPARMYCDSDQASLCWDCDAKVHSANFLVARHSRSLLCHVCQSTMAWSASGTKLGPTVSICERCVDGCDHNVKRNDDADGGDELSNEDENDAEDEYDGDEEEEEEEDDEEDALDDEDEDGDNQVVPWSSTPPPPAASSSSSEDGLSRFSNGDGDVSLKRMRETLSDLPFDDDQGYSSSARIIHTLPSAAAAALAGDNRGSKPLLVDSLLPSRPLKSRKIMEPNRSEYGPVTAAGSRSTAAIVESLRRFHEEDVVAGTNASETIAGIFRLSRNPS